MEDKIKQTCEKLEKEKGVRIIFAVENGSRAWRIASKDSDYDVRFVFTRPLEEYLKINRLREVIEYEEGDIDAVGFDIYKFCGLLLASNPTAIEWLASDIVYHGKQPKELVKFARKNFNPKALYYHYKSMCKQNYVKYIKGPGADNTRTYKKYLYAMRGLVNAKFVAEKNKIPPIRFTEALEMAKIPEHIQKEIREIIRLKKERKEKEITKNIVKIDHYIESELEKQEKVESIKKPQLVNRINEYIFKQIRTGK